MIILATGGAGYIGSHTCVELLENGHSVVVADNLSNSKEESLRRVREITARPLDFYRADILDKSAMSEIFRKHKIESVIHFAGLKAVNESTRIPLSYYRNNVCGTIALCEVMREFGVKNMVFSSSATVYGSPSRVPISEDFPLSAANPYGRTKLIIEDILRDMHCADPSWKIVILRYFNPVGAHPSARIGEDPNGTPNNLFPYMAQVAVGRLSKLPVYGRDYNTRDGTGVRDYIHVVDLARGHLKALDVFRKKPPIMAEYNLGTGSGYSVLETIAAFEKASGRRVNHQFKPRRKGDIAECYADPSKAGRELGWRAQKGLPEMCADTWRWQSNNPGGYP